MFLITDSQSMDSRPLLTYMCTEAFSQGPQYCILDVFSCYRRSCRFVGAREKLAFWTNMEGILDMVARIRERHFSVNSAPWTIGLGKQAITRGNGYKETTSMSAATMEFLYGVSNHLSIVSESLFSPKIYHPTHGDLSARCKLLY